MKSASRGVIIVLPTLLLIMIIALPSLIAQEVASLTVVVTDKNRSGYSGRECQIAGQQDQQAEGEPTK